MKIWLITVGEPLPGVDAGNPRLLRTGVLFRRLSELGHEVVWWTSAFDHFGKRHRVDFDTTITQSGGSIRLLRSVGYTRNLSLKRFIEHREVAQKFASAARDQGRPDIILASLPTVELAKVAVRYGREFDVPVVVDVRDLWPDALINLLPVRLHGIGRFALSWMIRDARWSLRHCSGIVGISPGYLAWGLGYAGRLRGPTDGIFPLGYVAPPNSPRSAGDTDDRMRSMGIDESKCLCWYVGSFGRQYDLGPVLESARYLYKLGRDDIQFVVSGEGENGKRWRALAGDSDNIVFTGWIGADEINWMRQRACIGLQPYVVNAPQGLANKLFEYLSAGIPVVSSLRGENEVLIEKHQCGLTYRAGDSMDFLSKVLQLVDNEDIRIAMGRRGKALFEAEFDGGTVCDGLIAHLTAIAAQFQHSSDSA